MLGVLETTHGTERKPLLTARLRGPRRDAAEGCRATRSLSSAPLRRRPQSERWLYFAYRTLCVILIIDPDRSDAHIHPQLTGVHVHHDAHGTPKDLTIPIDMWE